MKRYNRWKLGPSSSSTLEQLRAPYEPLAAIDQSIEDLKATANNASDKPPLDTIGVDEFSLSEVHITKVLQDGDPLGNNEAFGNAKAEGIDRIMNRGTFEIVEQSSLPRGANILDGSFTLSVKNIGTDS